MTFPRNRHLPLITLLMGCSTGGLETDGGRDLPPLFGQYDAIGFDIARNIQPQGIMQPDELPGSGSASYSGVLGFALVSGSEVEQIAGALTLSVGFGSNSLSGEAGQFQSETGVDYIGALSIENGQIDRAANIVSDFTATANLFGEISTTDGWSGTMNGVLAGDFYSDTNFFVGVVEGSILNDGSRLPLIEGVFLTQTN